MEHKFNSFGVCENPNISDQSTRSHNILILTAKAKTGWGYGYRVDSKSECNGSACGVHKRSCSYESEVEAINAGIQYAIGRRDAYKSSGFQLKLF